MKKIISIFTIFSFLIFTSCFTSKTVTILDDYRKFTNKEWVHVRYVKTKQGNIIKFNKFHPGKITETSIVELPYLRLSVGE
jgi:hypothetical protein